MKPSTALALYRKEIRRIVESHHGLNPVCWFRFAWRRHRGSDLDLLIDPGHGLGLLGVAKITLAIEEISSPR